MADQRSVEMLASFLLVELLPTKDLHKILADLWLPSQFSCVSAWKQLSKLTIVLSTWTTLELQPTMLQILCGTFGQPSSAFAKQDWKWNKETPFRRETGWTPEPNNFFRRNLTLSSESPQFSRKTQIPQTKKGTTLVSGNRELLHKFYSQDGRKD